MSDFLQANAERMRNAIGLIRSAGDRRSGALQRLGDRLSGIAGRIRDEKFTAGEAQKERDFQAEQDRLDKVFKEGETLTYYDFQREMAQTNHDNALKEMDAEARAYLSKKGAEEDQKDQRPLLNMLYNVANDIGSKYLSDGRYELLASGVPAFLGEWTANELDGLKEQIKQALRAEGLNDTEMRLIQGPLNNMFQHLYPGSTPVVDDTGTGKGGGRGLPPYDPKGALKGIVDKLTTNVSENMEEGGAAGRLEDLSDSGVFSEPEAVFQGDIQGTQESKAMRYLTEIIDKLSPSDRAIADTYISQLNEAGKHPDRVNILKWVKEKWQELK